MSTAVLCALRGAAETAVVRAIGGYAGRLEVTRRCADLAELLASASAGVGAVAVVAADLPGLDREAVRHLQGDGVWVMVVVGVLGARDADPRLLGADAVLDAVRAAEAGADVVALLDSAARTGARPGRPDATAGAGAGHEIPGSADPGRLVLGVPGEPAVDGGGPGPDTAPAGSRGTLVAVWGPTGAPGRTTVALNLAAELAPHGALLVDADTYGGTVAPMLGLLDEAPGLAAASRAAGTGRLDARALAALTPALDGGLRVLTGISRAERWPEIPAANLELVWAAARELSAWTVVDCGFAVEQDEALSYDTRAPRRNAATLSALAEADVVVVVGAGDPIGLQRLVRALTALGDLGAAASPPRVVVNRVRASASGPRPGDAIRDALRRYAGVPDVHLVPDDRTACDGAVLAGRTLREHAPGSPARRALAALAASLVAAPVAAGAH